MVREIAIFYQFCVRDFYIYAKRINTYIINFVILYPLTYIISFAFIQGQAYFGTNHSAEVTLFFAGNILLLMMSVTFELLISILFDLENTRTIEYRMLILPPRLVLLQQLFFTTLFSFILMIPFFPLSKLILGDIFVSTHTSWPLLMLMVFLSCLCCSAYNLLFSCALKNSRQIVHFWMRINIPLMNFGGFWAPWFIMNEFSPTLGILTQLNPLLYATEGIKQSIIPHKSFFSIGTCCTAIIGFSIICVVLSWYFFKKKVDHI